MLLKIDSNRFQLKEFALGVLFFLLFVVAGAQAQESSLRGDINLDGIIDGRDALKLMRGIEGLETLSDEEISRGDVDPLPGIGGRLVGDGEINRDDVQKILEYSVGLLAEGELNGDFANSGPAIESFSPPSGAVGTRVTIIGQRFLRDLQAENQVLFGDVPAPILELTSSRLVTEVPEGASTAHIRIQTPGGIAETAAAFRVTMELVGQLDLGEGLNPQDFVVANAEGETEVEGADGNFTLSVPDNQPSLIGAVPKGEGNHVYLALNLPGTGGSAKNKMNAAYGTAANPAHVDAESTARALVYLHPFLMTRSPSAAVALMQVMDGLSEIQALADVIDQRYPEGADGLNDAAVRSAWENAVAAVLEALPSGLVFSLDGTTMGKSNSQAATIQSLGVFRSAPFGAFGGLGYSSIETGDNQNIYKRSTTAEDTERTIKIYGADNNFLNARFDQESGGIDVHLDNGYSPLDWIATLFKIDPAGLPQGINTPFTQIRSNGYPHTGYQVSTLVPANLWTAKIDIFGAGLDAALGASLDWASMGDETLSLPQDEDAVFFLRMFSGSFRDTQGWDHQAIQAMEDGKKLSNHATAVNLVLALIDLWGLVGGEEKGFTQEATKAGVQSGIASLTQQTAGQNLSDVSSRQAVEILVNVLIEAGKGVMSVAVDEGISAAQEKLQGTLLSALKNANAITAVLGKVSSVGRIGERLAGLMGYLLNPLDLELSPGPTPLETMIVLVGDPFSPKITGFEPNRAIEGGTVKILGERFAATASDNTVSFNSVKAEVLGVNADRTELEVKVPQGVLASYSSSYSASVYVNTPAAQSRVQSPQQFTILGGPVITEIEPAWGYHPTDTFEGNEITIRGNRLAALSGGTPFRVYFADFPAEVISNTSSKIVARVPDVPAQVYDVSVYNPDLDVRSLPVQFNVKGKPVITKSEPASAHPGQFITIHGKHLNEAYFSVDGLSVFPNNQSDTFAVLQLPETETEEDFKIIASNSAGESEEFTVTYLEGYSLDQGFSVTVYALNSGIEFDGTLTLDEALAVARGDFNPFTTSWDDENLESIHHYHETKTEDDLFIWVEGTVVTNSKGTSPENEYHKHYRVDHYINGSVSEPYLTYAENLDQSSSNMEEGDYFHFYSMPDEFDWAAYDGSQFSDFIHCGYEDTYAVEDFSLETNDVFEMSEFATLTAETCTKGLANGSQAAFGGFQCPDPLLINANSAYIEAGEFSGSLSDAIIVRGDDNRIGAAVSIENAAGDGLLLQDCVGALVENITIRNCGGSGLHIDGGSGNQITGVYSENDDHGIEISGGSQWNYIKSVRCQDNEGDGIYIDGQSYKNTIQYCEVLGNRNGITVKGSENIIDLNYVSGNANYGFLLDGTDAQLNQCTYVTAGYHGIDENETPYLGNTNDGIRIQNGASENTLSNCSCYSNGGNGISLSGASTSSNTLLECTVGDTNSEYPDNSNSGFGIVIEGAPGTYIEDCVMALNGDGGIRVVDVEGSADEDSSITLSRLSFGYSVNVVGAPYRNSYALDGVSGTALHLENCSGVLFEDAYINGYDTGVYLLGTSGSTIESAYCYDAAEYGLNSESSAEDFVQLEVRGAGIAGMRWSGAQGTEIVGAYVVENQNDGVVLENCSNVTVRNMTLGQTGGGNGGYGLRVTSCLNTNLLGLSVYSNGSDGILLEQNSDNTLIEATSCGSNQGAGIRMHDVEGVSYRGSIEGEYTYSTSQVYSNMEGGVLIQDCVDVRIGEIDRYTDFYPNEGGGVIISGENTEDVSIVSTTFYDNPENTIYVQGGTNIQIGGSSPREGNYLGTGTGTGIRAEGEVQELLISNNTIGDPAASNTYYVFGQGIVLDDSITKVRIHANLIQRCEENGIWLTGGAHGNVITHNQIRQNGGHGILVEGTSTNQNQISRNSITEHEGSGIRLAGGNGQIEAPVIREIGWGGYNISGTVDNAPQGSLIEVYADANDEGEVLVGSCPVFGNNFYVSGSIPHGYNLHATVIHTDGNTSEFGPTVESPTRVDSFVFTSEEDENKDVFVKWMTQASTIRLTSDPANDYDPVLSEDQANILFTSERSGNPDLWIMRSDGEYPVQYTFTSEAEYSPDWHGATGNVALVSEQDGNPEIYTMMVDPDEEIGELSRSSDTVAGSYSTVAGNAIAVQFGAAKGSLTELKVYIQSAPTAFDWKIFAFESGFPRGTPLAEGTAVPQEAGWFSIDTGGMTVDTDYIVAVYFLEDNAPQLGQASDGDWFSVWSYYASSGNWAQEFFLPVMIHAVISPPVPVRITENAANDIDPCWSPDAQQIAFASDRGGNFDIWIMDADGGNLHQLTDGNGSNTKPAWSPDGSYIAFVSDRDGNEEIYVIGTNGAGLSRLTELDSSETDPAWSRDSSYVFYSSDADSGYEIYMRKPGQASGRRVTYSLGDSTQPNAGSHSTGTTMGKAALAAVTQSQPQLKRKTSGILGVNIDSASTDPGNTVSLAVHLSDAVSLGNLAFELDFDGTTFELLEPSLDDFGSGNGELYAMNPELFPWEGGSMYFNWIGAYGLTGFTDVMELVFLVKNLATEGDYPIDFKTFVAYDTGLNYMDVAWEGGIIHVEGDGTDVSSWMLYTLE